MKSLVYETPVKSEEILLQELLMPQQLLLNFSESSSVCGNLCNGDNVRALRQMTKTLNICHNSNVISE